MILDNVMRLRVECISSACVKTSPNTSSCPAEMKRFVFVVTAAAVDHAVVFNEFHVASYGLSSRSDTTSIYNRTGK